jgi:hypothetical protein
VGAFAPPGRQHGAASLTDLLERLPAPGGPGGNLAVRWFDAWHPMLDEALQTLPEMESCPHELFRELCQTPSPVRKQMALVSRHGEPVAIAGLRRKRWDWEPLGAGMGGINEVMPAQPGMLFPALAALRKDVLVWGWGSALPPAWVRDLRQMPVWKVNLETDFEAFWRQTGYLNTIKRNRRRTKSFTFAVNAPGAAEWAIQQWADRYRYETNRPADAVDDYLARARYLEPRGRLFTFLLLDGDQPVAGSIGLVHGQELLWLCPSRRDDYESYGVGSRLLELICFWAAEHGYTRVDLGPTNDYKARWGPVETDRWTFRVSPPHLECARKAGRLGRDSLVSLRQHAKNALRYATRRADGRPD